MTALDSILLKLLPIQRLNDLRLAKASKGALKAEFKDDKGRWWYTFADGQDMPLARLAEQQTHLQFLAAGLTGQSFKDAMDVLTECLALQDIVKAGVIIHDLKELPKNIVNVHALINVISVNYIREDENPNLVSPSIHKQKCNWMLEQIEEGSFFLKQPSLMRSLSPFNLSGQQLTDNLAACLKLLKEQKQRLDIIRSMNNEARSEKTATT